MFGLGLVGVGVSFVVYVGMCGFWNNGNFWWIFLCLLIYFFNENFGVVVWMWCFFLGDLKVVSCVCVELVLLLMVFILVFIGFCVKLGFFVYWSCNWWFEVVNWF